jgi:hypothetical protein
MVNSFIRSEVTGAEVLVVEEKKVSMADMRETEKGKWKEAITPFEYIGRIGKKLPPFFRIFRKIVLFDTFAQSCPFVTESKTNQKD